MPKKQKKNSKIKTNNPETVEISNDDNNDNSNNENIIRPDISPNNENPENPEKKSENNPEENVERTITGSTNSSNIDLFQNSNFEFFVKEKELIPEHERIYQNDEIYLEDLQNQLLNNYPINRQGSKFIQDTVLASAQNIINLKNYGLEILGKKYELIGNLENVKNLHFDKPWFVPIVLDKMKVYEKNFLNQQTMVQEQVTDKINYVCDECNVSGIEVKSQKDELANYKTIFDLYRKNKIILEKYQHDYHHLINPYFITKVLDGKDVGYHVPVEHSAEVLRFFDIQTKYWNIHQVLDPIYTTIEILDEKKKLKNIEEHIMIPGDELNIVGFMYLPPQFHHIHDLVDYGIESDELTNRKKNRFSNHFGLSAIISKIQFQKNKNVILSIPNHQLSNNDFIYLQNTNSFPSIDGYYDKIVIIDDNTIQLNASEKIGKITNPHSGNTGNVYSLLKLHYNTVMIRKEGDEWISQPENYQWTEPLLFLFNKNLLTGFDYYQILQKIMPTNRDVIQLLEKNIEKCYTLDQIQGFLQLYNIDYNQLSINDFDLLKQQLQQKIQTMERYVGKLREIAIYQKIAEMKRDVPVEERKYLENLDLFGDHWFTDPKIIEIYGKYPLLGQIYDSLDNRRNWILQQFDNGNLYFTYVLSEMTMYSKNTEKNIRALLKKIKESLERSQTSLDKIEKTNQYFRCPLFIEANTFEQLTKDGKVYENNTFALVNKIELYEWNNGEWRKKKTFNTPKKLQYLCEIGDEEFENINLNTYDPQCISVLDKEKNQQVCKNRQLYRLKENIQYYDNKIKEFEDWITEFEEQTQKFLYQEKYNRQKYIYQLHHNLNIIYENQEKAELDASVVIPEEELTPVKKILNKIMLIQNEDIRNNLLFQYLDFDGLIIGDDYYSKKYGDHIICGHWKYLKEMMNTDDNNIREEISNRLLVNFGDDGNADEAYNTCKNCGVRLNIMDYDLLEGFDKKTSQQIFSREVYVKEKDEEAVTDIKENIMEELQNVDSFSLNSPLVMEALMQLNSNIKRTHKNIIDEMIVILQSLLRKVDIEFKLSAVQLIHILNDVYISTTRLPTFEILKNALIFRIKNEGKTDDYIKRLEKTPFFEDRYKSDVIHRKIYAMTARLFIALETSIKMIQFGRQVMERGAGCAFETLDKPKGFEFFACLLMEMRLLQTSKKEDRIEKDKIVENIRQYYNEFLEKRNIQELYTYKQKYQSQETDIDRTLTQYRRESIDRLDHEPEHINKISDEEKREFMEPTKYTKWSALHQKIAGRVHTIISIIKKEINKAVALSPVLEGQRIENACCADLLEEISTGRKSDKKRRSTKNEKKESKERDLMYMDYFIEKMPEINELLEEMIELSTLLQSIKLRNYYSRIILLPDSNRRYYQKMIQIEDDPVQEIIQLKFRKYCYEGDSRGLFHIFVKADNIGGNSSSIASNTRCILCQKTIKELEETQYTNEQYKQLLEDIQKNNINKLQPISSNVSINLMELKNKMKKEMNEKVDLLFTVIAKMMGRPRDATFIEKYKRIFMNLGKNNDEPLINQQQVLKNYINRYLRTFISIIRNKLDKKLYISKIEIFESEELSKKFQEYLYKEYDRISRFITEENIKTFASLTFIYSIDQVNQVYGRSPIYERGTGKILENPDITLEDSIKILQFIFIEELLHFVHCTQVSNYDLEENIEIEQYELVPEGTVENTCKLISEFVIYLLDYLHNNEEVINISKTTLENYMRLIDYYNEKERMIDLEQQTEDFKAIIQIKMRTQGGLTSDDYRELQQQYLENQADEAIKDSSIRQRVIDELKKKLGRDPSDDDIETAMDNYKETMEDHNAELDENYDLDQEDVEENPDVIEVGNDYGEIEPNTDFD